MAVSNTSILRLHRTDKPPQHLLVQVSKCGNKALDLKLIGSEHEHLYHAQLEETKVKSLQANSFSGDLTEWKAILKYVLLHEKPSVQTPEYLQGLETVAQISGKTLTITIRKNIKGITQRLGEIKLEQDDDREEVSVFEWVDTAAASADSMRAELERLQASVDEQREQVASLNKQLDGLVRAKKEHEDELLGKFTALLNAKKLKIRDQQRLLAGAQVDPEAVEAIGEARSGNGKSRKSARSRKGKRKADRADELEDEDMDEEEEDRDEDELPQETPVGSDDEATEDDDDLDGPRSRAVPSDSHPDMDVDEPGESPSKRKLPSRSQEPQPTAAAARQNENDDDDDETDDEL